MTRPSAAFMKRGSHGLICAPSFSALLSAHGSPMNDRKQILSHACLPCCCLALYGTAPFFILLVSAGIADQDVRSNFGIRLPGLGRLSSLYCRVSRRWRRDRLATPTTLPIGQRPFDVRVAQQFERVERATLAATLSERGSASEDCWLSAYPLSSKY